MHALQIVAPAVALAVLACAQAPPPPVLLTATESGVLPVLPTETPFPGVETIEGAITYDGPMNPGFTGLLGNASVQSNTPGASFAAILPITNFDDLTGSTITGTIIGTVPANGTGVLFTVHFTGFPSEAAYGPFVYHVHALAVPSDGNCSSTLGHLDPTDRGEYYPCDPTQPETCQAGDLSGKHGNITETTFTASYLDLYLSSDPTSPYFFGNKAIVIHSSNTTRLTCANFAQLSNSTAASGTNGTAFTTIDLGTTSAGLVSVYAPTVASTITSAGNVTVIPAPNTSAPPTGATPTAASSSAGVTPYPGSSGASGTNTATAALPSYTGAAERTVAGSIAGAIAFVIGAVLL